MTLLQIGVPLGIVLGYILTSLIKNSLSWIYSFIIQSVMMAVLMLITLFIPNKFFSSTHHARITNKKQTSQKLTIDTLYSDANKEENNQGKSMKSFCKKFCSILTYNVI